MGWVFKDMLRHRIFDFQPNLGLSGLRPFRACLNVTFRPGRCPRAVDCAPSGLCLEGALPEQRVLCIKVNISPAPTGCNHQQGTKCPARITKQQAVLKGRNLVGYSHCQGCLFSSRLPDIRQNLYHEPKTGKPDTIARFPCLSLNFRTTDGLILQTHRCSLFIAYF
jgi:hypothetical protein